MLYNDVATNALHCVVSCGKRCSDMEPKFSVKTAKEAIALASVTKQGDLVTVVNSSNLSEVLLYERTSFAETDRSILKWDGHSVSYEWFIEDANKYTISNAEELAGFAEMVRSGKTFYGKTIMLSDNIDLNHKEWAPIGVPYEEERIGQGREEYYEIKIPKNDSGEPLAFSGVFDGNGKVIYGLSMKNSGDNTFAGFFTTLYNASIRNVVFEDIDMGEDAGEPGCFAALFGYAESTVVTNVIVSGKICGERISGIGAIAKDTTFYECNNRVALSAKNGKLGRIVIGGIVQQLGLSEDMISQLNGHEPNMFVGCNQNGNLRVNAAEASYLWGGQLYGFVAHQNSMQSHGMIIDRCNIDPKNPLLLENLDTKKTKAVICGAIDGTDDSVDYVSGVNDKTDLLGGLIGKTGNEISVTVIKTTESRVMDSIVIPGTVNTLYSMEGSGSFLTTAVEGLRLIDGIANLEPYFAFVSVVRA